MSFKVYNFESVFVYKKIWITCKR